MTTVGTLYSSTARTTALDSIGGNSFDSTIPGLLQQAIVAVGNNGGGGSGSTAWGAITGTLSNQTDLAAALALKASLSGATFTGAVNGTAFLTINSTFPTRTLQIANGSSVEWNDTSGTGFSVAVRPDAPSANRVVNFNPNGNLVSTADTGSVSSAMLAGSITPSKITGTAAILGANTFTALQQVSLSSLGTTPSGALTLQNTTAAALGAQQVSPFLSLIGNGWNNSSNASHPIEFAWHVLPVQGNPITGSLFLRSRVNNGSWGNCARFYNQQDSVGTVLSLTSAYGTVDLTIGGAGTLRANISSTGAGSFQIDNGGGNPVILSSRASAWLGLGTAAASPVEQTFAGCDGSGTNITGGILNISAGRGTGTGIAGVLNFRSHAAAASGSTVNTSPVTVMQITNSTLVTLSSGVALRLGNAATTGLTPGVEAALTNATIVLQDSTGQAYRIPCII